ncbi:MAG TPA: sugar transferase, partial [Gemmatimonadaceae bacterium]|jgi:lipopolysaccharide/colanic/teichoic acid biosynthesis glycosyltransferase
MTSSISYAFERRSARQRAAELTNLDRARRALNVSVALVGLLTGLPVMAVISVLVRLTSPGPVFYVQTRIGLDRRRGRHRGGAAGRDRDLGGRPFRIYKFRTMRVQAAEVQTWARPDDDRVTPVGRVLRKFRLDELPQLLNVLRGDMNVVGPRPEQPEIFADLRKRVDRYTWRQRVLPGITGWAQVNAGYDRNVDDVRRKLDFDLEYLSRRSPYEDARIMLRTVPVMLGRRGW